MLICRSAVEDMVDHARHEAPNECCGFLLGGRETIEEGVRANNLTPTPNRYLVDPRDHFAVIRQARIRGCIVVGTYHSHPTSVAIPSAVDLEQASSTGYLYVIVSLLTNPDGGPIGAFRFVRGGFERVHLEAC
jgi:proteasome lid subunit RPN8/RPN11